MQKGIHIVDKWTSPVPQEVYESNASHITICRYWDNLNPSNGQYDWTDLDTDIANIRANNKTFGLKIAAGDKTPSWVYSLPVTKLTFSEFVGDDNTLVSIDQPVFWENNYKAAWTTFITALSAHLQADADVWASLTNVYITGINRKTDEFRICAQESEYRAPYTSSDAVTLWNSVGYTELDIVLTQIEFSTLFATQFPGKDLGFSLTNYGTTPPFPAITGWTDMNQNAINDLIPYASNLYVIYTSVKWTNGSANLPATVTTQAKNSGLMVAGQLSEKQFGEGLANYSDLLNAIQASIDEGYAYVEIHDESVTDVNPDHNYNQYITYLNSLFDSPMDIIVNAQEIEEYQLKLNACLISLGKKLLSYLRTNYKVSKCIQRNIYYLLIIRNIINDLGTQECLTDDELLVVTEKINNLCYACKFTEATQNQAITIRNCINNASEYNEEFENLTSGNTVTLFYDPCPSTKMYIYRNGIRQDSDEVTVSGKILTFVTSFSISSGGAAVGESVYVEYITSF